MGGWFQPLFWRSCLRRDLLSFNPRVNVRRTYTYIQGAGGSGGVGGASIAENKMFFGGIKHQAADWPLTISPNPLIFLDKPSGYKPDMPTCSRSVHAPRARSAPAMSSDNPLSARSPSQQSCTTRLHASHCTCPLTWVNRVSAPHQGHGCIVLLRHLDNATSPRQRDT